MDFSVKKILKAEPKSHSLSISEVKCEGNSQVSVLELIYKTLLCCKDDPG